MVQPERARGVTRNPASPATTRCQRDAGVILSSARCGCCAKTYLWSSLPGLSRLRPNTQSPVAPGENAYLCSCSQPADKSHRAGLQSGRAGQRSWQLLQLACCLPVRLYHGLAPSLWQPCHKYVLSLQCNHNATPNCQLIFSLSHSVLYWPLQCKLTVQGLHCKGRTKRYSRLSEPLCNRKGRARSGCRKAVCTLVSQQHRLT